MELSNTKPATGTATTRRKLDVPERMRVSVRSMAAHDTVHDIQLQYAGDGICSCKGFWLFSQEIIQKTEHKRLKVFVKREDGSMLLIYLELTGQREQLLIGRQTQYMEEFTYPGIKTGK